jgi:uncharacterized damage-inducible protein DinB
MTPDIATLMARYNRWMNERMYDAAATLDAETLAADKGAFFGSILATLNHIAVADLVWLNRFAQYEGGFRSLQSLENLPTPRALDQPLAPDLPGLRRLRTQLDALIETWVGELTPGHMAGELAYGNMAGKPQRRAFGALLQHFFNHQTHHRGQASTLLHQSGVDIGVTDLLALIPQGWKH